MKAPNKLINLAKLSLARAYSSDWLELADFLRTCSASRAEASHKLESAWGPNDKPSYRSKIACLAHPQDLEAFKQAGVVGIGVKDLITLARGNARFDGKKVVRILQDRRGGWNRETPQDRLAKQLEKAVSEAKDSGLRSATISRLFSYALSAAFNKD